MPQSGVPQIFGELATCEDGIAQGWVQLEESGPCTVIVRLDGVPVGAGTCMATGVQEAPGGRRRAVQVELDASRIARGGLLTAEQVSGVTRRPLAGQIVLAADGANGALQFLADSETYRFTKRSGLRVSGWIAVHKRGSAPRLSGLIAGRCVLKSGPAAFSPEAWKAGGQLASGYEITFPLIKKANQGFEAVLCSEVDGREVWRGAFDASDIVNEDICQITALGACRGGQSSPAFLNERCEAFIRQIETTAETSLIAGTAALALRLVSWMRDMRGAETAFASAIRLKPSALMRLLPGPFLETLASLVCALPRSKLESAIKQLDDKTSSEPAHRTMPLLKVLAQTRLTGLDDGGERIIRILHGMNYGQSALNWIWEAVRDSGPPPASVADLRQAIEFEIIARNVPFLSGYELIASRPV